MSILDYEQDPTELILSQIKEHNQQQPSTYLQSPFSYLQVKYLDRHILKLNPQQAETHEKTVEEENMQEYLQESEKDQCKQQQYHHRMMKRFFRIRNKTPQQHRRLSHQVQPIDMIKSYSKTEVTKRQYSLLTSAHLVAEQNSVDGSRVRKEMTRRYNDSVRNLMASAQQLITKKRSPRLRGGTMIEQEKMFEKVLRKQKHDILGLLQSRDYSKQQPKSVQQIPNKQKYSLGYLQYLRLKTKVGLEKQLYERRVRRVTTKVQNFQQFIIREGQFRPEQTAKLHGIYTKMREEMRRSRHHPHHNIS